VLILFHFLCHCGLARLLDSVRSGTRPRKSCDDRGQSPNGSQAVVLQLGSGSKGSRGKALDVEGNRGKKSMCSTFVQETERIAIRVRQQARQGRPSLVAHYHPRHAATMPPDSDETRISATTTSEHVTVLPLERSEVEGDSHSALRDLFEPAAFWDNLDAIVMAGFDAGPHLSS
jgi:hypothetical protein